MKDGIKRVIRYTVIPVYAVLFLFNIYFLPMIGPLLNLFILMAGMWAFTKRKLPLKNYIIAGALMFFFIILYADNFLYIGGTPHPFDLAGNVLGLRNRWFFYGALYTVFVLGFGIQYIIRKKKSPHQVLRTLSVMTVQIILAFSIPFVMFLIAGRDYYFSYFWPLEIKYFYPDTLSNFPFAIILYSFIGSLILFPVLAVLLGKRFYCSWVCGCGALAETYGDRWRHLSDKSKSTWKFERFSVHAVLILAVITTALVITEWLFSKNGISAPVFSDITGRLRGFYAYIITFALAGGVGVGFYPVLGSRVWCRFFCPMAAALGILQRKSRFHIRVKPDMCISCGQCSTYCEMGIDVRAYAQRNESFVRNGCVGCGMCAHVCPRGVLRLENKRSRDRIDW
jgi:NAD-dependent dihydropyrimidine dehydrogenase PreA subunit